MCALLVQAAQASADSDAALLVGAEVKSLKDERAKVRRGTSKGVKMDGTLV